MARWDLTITEDDKTWLNREQPLLEIHEGSPERITGLLYVNMTWDEESGGWIINPKLSEFPGNYIQDRYEIEISMAPGIGTSLPLVTENGGRINKKDKRRHIYDNNGVCCLNSPLEEKKIFADGYNLPKFFTRLVIPFFYGQSHFDLYDEWPSWGEYSHGSEGLLESYALLSPTDDNIARSCIEHIERLEKDRAWFAYKQALKNGDISKLRTLSNRAMMGLFKLKKDGRKIIRGL